MPATTDTAVTHPRPQLRRGGWTSLDGRWDFAWDPNGDRRGPHGRPRWRGGGGTSLDGRWDFAWDPNGDRRGPHEPGFSAEIVVPFAPETPASGLGRVERHRACWYRRTFPAPALAPGERLLL